MPNHPIIRFKKRVTTTPAAAPNGTASQKRRKSSMKQLVSQHRLSMPGISYAKAMEFPADGPGRVIVRLERLMGSDRIRITDPKYMATLLQRLTEEEELTWQKRTRERRKAEHNRFRQLVIDGYTEPTPGMEDLYNHPVFRVNRILNRLNRLNNLPVRTNSLPPIIPVDPFRYDESGRVFKSYSGHFAIERPGRKKLQSASTLSITGSSSAALATSRSQTSQNLDRGKVSSNQLEQEESGDDDYDDGNEIKGEFYSKIGHNKNVVFSTSSSPTISPPKTESKSQGTGAIDKNNGETEVKADGPKVQAINIQQLQRKYGVAQKTNLGIRWNPYRSEIVEPLFNDEERGVWDLYEMGTNIVNLYDKQQQITDDYIASLNQKYMKKCKGSSSKVKSKKRIFGEVDRGFDDSDVSTETEVECDDADDDMPRLTSSTVRSETEGPPTWDNITSGMFFGEEEGDVWEEYYEMPGEDDEYWNVSDLEYPDDGNFYKQVDE